MSAYRLIFSSIPAVVCILGALGTLSLVFERNTVIGRSILFSFQLWLAPLIYFIYTVTKGTASSVILLAGFVELLFLGMYVYLFRRLLLAVTGIDAARLPELLRHLNSGTFVIVALEVALFLQGGVGIFSKGSRISFLGDSRLNLYLTYFGLLVEVILVPIVAAIVNLEKRWCWPVLRYLLVISLLSILSASKGSAILTLVSILSLVKTKRNRELLRLLWLPIAGVAVLITATVFYVGRFLSVSTSEMISEMYSRVFLTNDCRALAIDWSSQLAASGTSLFRESFRSYAGLLGVPPKYPPLGQLLYSLQFGTGGMLGANTSSTALLIAYGGDLERITFCGFLVCTAVIIGAFATPPTRKDIRRLTVGIFLLSLLSQDFLAFQVVANTLVLLSVSLVFKHAFGIMVKCAAEGTTDSETSVALMKNCSGR